MLIWMVFHNCLPSDMLRFRRHQFQVLCITIATRNKSISFIAREAVVYGESYNGDHWLLRQIHLLAQDCHSAWESKDLASKDTGLIYNILNRFFRRTQLFIKKLTFQFTSTLWNLDIEAYFIKYDIIKKTYSKIVQKVQ